MGFCHEALPTLLPAGHHGPLVVALDSNILVDLQQHGAALMNDEPLPEGVADDGDYSGQLYALADLVNLWMMRDIRFIVTPRSKTDAKKVTPEFLARRLPAIDALADSLAFQLGDWVSLAPSERTAVHAVGEETGLPDGADRDLVLEAQAIGAHVFLTRDRRVLERTALTGRPMALLSPRTLAGEFAAIDGLPLFGGVCAGVQCPYREWPYLGPDIGKWQGLLSILG